MKTEVAPGARGWPARRAWTILRQSPATFGLAALWVLVYALMAAAQGSLHNPGGGLMTGGIQTPITHLFGDQTPAEIAAGRLWRAETATVVHYSLVHLGLNLVGLVLFGRIVEAWYGGGPLLAFYAVVGLAGNVLSAYLKLWAGADRFRPSGGGSGVVVGLIALVAVGAWRSSGRFGGFVREQMLMVLATMVLAGFLFPLYDNTGHATGAVLGILVGLGHSRIMRMSGRSKRLAGGLGVASLVACGLVLWASSRAELRARSQQVTITRLALATRELKSLANAYLELARRGPVPRPPSNRWAIVPDAQTPQQLRQRVATSLSNLDALGITPRDAAASRRLHALAAVAAARAPTPGDRNLFVNIYKSFAEELDGEFRAIIRTLPRVPR